MPKFNEPGQQEMFGDEASPPSPPGSGNIPPAAQDAAHLALLAATPTGAVEVLPVLLAGRHDDLVRPVVIPEEGQAQLKPHDLAAIFPMLNGSARLDFDARVAANGVVTEILLFEGKILDGRNRYEAARAHNKPLSFAEFLGSYEQARERVILLNRDRRQLTPVEKACAAARLVSSRHGGARRGQFQGANLPLEHARVTVAAAAKRLGVSTRHVKSAYAILQKGSPKLIALTEIGKISLEYADVFARSLSVAEQDAEVDKGPGGRPGRFKLLKAKRAQSNPDPLPDACETPDEVQPHDKGAFVVAEQGVSADTDEDNVGGEPAPGPASTTPSVGPDGGELNDRQLAAVTFADPESSVDLEPVDGGMSLITHTAIDHMSVEARSVDHDEWLAERIATLVKEDCRQELIEHLRECNPINMVVLLQARLRSM